jgi:hypothetical protein
LDNNGVFANTSESEQSHRQLFTPLVSTKGRNGCMIDKLNTTLSMKLYMGSSTRVRGDAT